MSSLSINKLAMRGAFWTFLGYGVGQSLRLGSNLILTRLLVPEMFGLMTLINVFILGLSLFSDIGVGPSIIQHKLGDEPKFYNTAWTLQVIRGGALWLICLGIAYPVSQIYQEPRLLWLIPIVGLSTIISGFNSTALFTLNRQIALGKLTLLELGIQIISLLVMLVWAWFSPTIWSLVAGNLVSVLLKMVMSHYLIPETKNRFTWDQDALGELFSFGRWIFISTAMTFLSTQTDRLLLGKLLALKTFGIYNVAFLLAQVPQSVIGTMSNKVIFPVVSRYNSLPRSELRSKIIKKRRLILFMAIPMLAVLSGFGDNIMYTLYDERYKDAGWIMPILALGIWPNLLTVTMNPCLLAVGKPLYSAWGNFLKFCYLLVALPLGYSLMGLTGAVIVIALNDFPFYGAVCYGLWREKLSVISQDLQTTALLIAIITLICWLRHIFGLGLPIDAIL